MTYPRISRALPFLLLGLVPSLLHAQITGWRGNGTGMYPNAKPATTWSTTQSVVWSVPLDTWSNSLPVLVGEKLFIEAEPFDLICLSAKDGQILWRKSNPLEEALSPEMKAQFEANKPQVDALKKEMEAINKQIEDIRAQRKANPSDATLKDKQDALRKSKDEIAKKMKPLSTFDLAPTHPTNGYSSPTPISDGERIYTLFASGVAACHDLDGNRLWIKFIERPSSPMGWGHSSSPRLVDGKLIVHITDMWALDPATGEVLWQTATPIGWGTAFVSKIGKESILVTPQGAILRVADGRVLAKDLFKMPYGSPIVADGVIYSVDEAGAVAIELPDAITGDAIEGKILWQKKPEELPRKDRYYASPILHENILYVVAQNNSFAALDSKTGNEIFKQVLDIGKGTVFPSIVFAGQHLIVSCDTGISVVLEPGREYKEVARNTLEPFRSTPVFDGNRMYVRALARMYCIGE